MMQHKPLLKKYLIPSLLFVFGACLGVSLLVFIPKIFQITHIEVFGVIPEERVILNKLLKQKSILFFQPSQIKKLVSQRFPYMEIKEIQIILPSTLVLSIAKEKPVAYLQTDNGYVILSANGTVLEKVRSTERPFPFMIFYQVVHHSEYQVGQKIGFSSIKKAIEFVTLLTDEGYVTETVAIDSVDMIACKTKGFEVVFSQTRPVGLQENEVRQIIKQVKAGALRIERLDLRFDKPVVQLPPK